MAGDVRVNENPGLQSMHTIWFREHNRIAALVKNANPILNDDVIYLESRRLVGAQMQKIVFGDFLPIVLGDNVMREYGIDVDTESKYKANISPNIFNSFAAAAFR
jgi:peroxidase